MKISHAYFLIDYANMRNVAFEQIYIMNGKQKSFQDYFWLTQVNHELEMENSS